MWINKDYIFFWLDELEFTIDDYKKSVLIYDEENLQPLVWDLDFDNSNQWYINFATLNWSYTSFSTRGFEKWLKFSTIIDKKNIDLFCILKWRENKWIDRKTKDKVVFYSSFFVLENSNKLPFSINEFFETFFDWKKTLYRLDIAFDLPYEIKKIKQNLFKNVNFFSEIWIDKKHPEFSQTYYIKNPLSNTNRKFIFRIYDKILDTWRKKKGFLYPHLENNPDVRRIELELRPEECKRFVWINITDILINKNKCVQKIFTKYFNRFTEKKLKYDDIVLKKYVNEKFDLNSFYLENWHIPKDYVSHFHWYIKNIYQNTWYKGLFDCILWVKKTYEQTIKTKTTSFQAEFLKSKWYDINKKLYMTNQNIFKWYELLENLIEYLYNSWLNQATIYKILKNNIKKPILKINKNLWKK